MRVLVVNVKADEEDKVDLKLSIGPLILLPMQSTSSTKSTA